MKTPHIVPLSKQALEVLATIREMRGLSGLLFQGERDQEKPIVMTRVNFESGTQAIRG